MVNCFYRICCNIFPFVEDKQIAHYVDIVVSPCGSPLTSVGELNVFPFTTNIRACMKIYHITPVTTYTSYHSFTTYTSYYSCHDLYIISLLHDLYIISLLSRLIHHITPVTTYTSYHPCHDLYIISPLSRLIFHVQILHVFISFGTLLFFSPIILLRLRTIVNSVCIENVSRNTIT